MTGAQWYVAHTHPRAEVLAQAHLQRQQFDVCLPRLRVPRLRRGRWQEAVEPLFPRYLFVGVQDGQSVAPARSSRGVATLVRCGERFATVTEELIHALRSRGDAEGIAAAARAHPFLEGDCVRIVGGPFQDLEGIYCEASGDGRVRILMDLLGTSTSVTINAGLLVPSKAAAAGLPFSSTLTHPNTSLPHYTHRILS